MALDTVTPRQPAGTRRSRCRGSHNAEAAPTIPLQGNGAIRFAHSLLALTRSGIQLRAAALETRRAAPDDDVAWWEATMALNRALRRRHAGHEAAMAARLASQAVLAAATRTGLTVTPDVTAVARSAGEAARVLIAGDLHPAAAAYLTGVWEELLTR